ncbi:MAG: 50S ribosomal protein L1 [Alphaproteobacteria bacterium]|nr:50S ribosomal protein L1 [Alphaproteobacteria bacterium]
MAKLHGKRYRALRESVEDGLKYGIDEACGLVEKTGTAKFDESVDVAVRLGVNPRQADQMVRGTVSLPHGSGKTVRVVVFADGEAARAAEEAGADFVGSDDLVAKIQNENWTDFDKAIATRNMMAKVGRLGRVLGPRNLMPNPKTGTVVGPEQIAEVIREVKGGRLDFKVEKAGILHVSIGKKSMGSEKIRDNLLAFMRTVLRLKPSSAKGTYVKSVALSTTMGVGIRLDPNEVSRLAQESR